MNANTKLVFLLVGAGIAFMVARKALIDNGTEKTAGVTQSATSGGTKIAPIISSPINEKIVAWIGGLYADTPTSPAGPSSVFNFSGDKMQAFGNVQSAIAAYNAPLRPEVSQSTYSQS